MPGGGSARSPGDGPAAGPRPAQAAATSGKSMSTDLGSTGSGCEGGPHSVQIAIPYGNCVQRFPKGARRGRQGGAKDPLPPPPAGGALAPTTATRPRGRARSGVS